jgi:hypothetical protein
MKRFIAASCGAVLLAACAEPTAPSAGSDLHARFARKPSGQTLTVAGNLQNNVFQFSGADYAMEGSTSTTLSILDGNLQAVSVLTEELPAQPGNYVLGRLNNDQVAIGILPGATKYEVSFDLYVIGSWDGRGQQAQNGAFGQDSWQISAKCGETFVNIFTTTFSNQKSVQQNYPNPVTGKSAQWLTGSSGSNKTGFDVPVPLFSSVTDSWYELTYKGTNPCGAEPFTAIHLSIPGFSLQSRADESWAVDRLQVKTDNN